MPVLNGLKLVVRQIILLQGYKYEETGIIHSFVANLLAQSISHVEKTKNWYYIYDQSGKKIKAFSTSQGELKGYSSTFYIIKQGTAFYITYDVNGKRLHTFGVLC